MLEKIKPNHFYWQVQIKHPERWRVIGYIKKTKKGKYKWSVFGEDWTKGKKMIDGCVRALLKEHGFDPIHDHGSCIAIPQTYKNDWK